MILGSRDEAILGATDTLAAAQGVGGEAAKDKDQDIIREDVYFIPLIRGPSSIFTRIWWSGVGDGSGSTVA